MSASAKNVRPTFGMLVLAVAGGMGFGALNEVIEFIATLMYLGASRRSVEDRDSLESE